MANLVVLGLEGDRRMVLVDIDAMTVDAIDPAAIDGDIESARNEGRTMIKGVNVAVARAQHSPSASYPFTEPQ